jgi:hypothetical protein
MITSPASAAVMAPWMVATSSGTYMVSEETVNERSERKKTQITAFLMASPVPPEFFG